MTRSEAAPSSLAEYEKDKHSRTLPGGRAGPNKDGGAAIGGLEALGTEIGAEQDARRERAQATREGEVLPAIDAGQGSQEAGELGFGQQSGFEKGMGDTPSFQQREQAQDNKNSEWGSHQPDLRNLARNSAGTSNPQQDQNSIVSSANRRPEEILDTAGRSLGTESGAGGYQGGILNQANTSDVPDQ